ncbi:SusC/RagA family TonB-linked outer membrane protein [Puteibacter caeruleilacunae]|nr:SusC/RagA family TonB-linked outer membrane protein [Puteibacter caeruleilacunae]
MKKKWIGRRCIPSRLKKILLIMKLTFIVVFLFTMHLSASVYSQKTKLSLTLRNVSVQELLENIESTSDYRFMLRKENVDLERKVSLSANNQTIEEILTEIFKSENVKYLITDKNLVILHAEAPKNSVLLKETKKNITGIVTDEMGEPLPGVSVIIEGTTIGITTDFDGKYELSVPSEYNQLTFSFVGMKKQVVEIGDQNVINITLVEDAIGLEEVVAVGYGVQKKVNLTGSVATVDAAELENRPVPNVSTALQGMAPGLNVSITNAGGQADAAMNINIRGTGSLSSSAPLVLVDGVKASINDVNPNDIKNVSVLKDASSAAIYGAEAAYGVILITTKDGQRNKDFTINYSNNLSVKKMIFVPKQVSSVDYANYWNVAHMNSHGSPQFSDEQIQEMQDVIDGVDNPYGIYGTKADPKKSSLWIGLGDNANDWTKGRANNDWFDILYRDYSFVQQHNVSVSGGSKKVTGFLSMGYLHNPGQLNYGKEYFKRYNFTSKVGADVTSWLNVSANVRYSRKENSFPEYDNGTGNPSQQRLYHDALRMKPLVPFKTPAVYDDSGKEIVSEQLANIPFKLENSGFEEYLNEELIATLKGEISLMPGWKLKGDYSYKKKSSISTRHVKKATHYGPDGSPSLLYNVDANNRIRKGMSSTFYKTFNVYSQFNKTFNQNHEVSVLVGYQQQDSDSEGLSAQNSNILNDDLSSLNLSVGENIDIGNSISTWGTLGAFARFGYIYGGKYMIEFNGRSDATSKFPENNRGEFFPSTSIGYNVHNEKFWESISTVVNTLKLRASYGTLGNQNVAAYKHLPNIPIKDNLGWIIGGERPYYSKIPAIVSSDLTWEVSKTKNIGVEMSFLSHRLSVSGDIYNRRTENMFGPMGALPSVLGTNPPTTNSATLETKGFELLIGWRHKVNNKFGYDLQASLSNNKTTIVDYFNPTKVLSSHYEGKELGEIWGYVANDLFQTQEEVDAYLAEHDMTQLGSAWRPGNVKYLNLDDDPALNIGDNTVDNPGDRKIIGNSKPRYLYSIKGGFNYGNLDFNMFWQGVGKRDVVFSGGSTTFWGWSSHSQSHVSPEVMDYWSEKNPNGYLPIPLDKGGKTGNGKDRLASTRYLQSGAYLRLKNVQLGYTFPKRIIDKIGIRKLRVFVSGENLLTITNMWSAFDPEIAGLSGKYDRGRAYPLSSSLSMGVNVTF